MGSTFAHDVRRQATKAIAWCVLGGLIWFEDVFLPRLARSKQPPSRTRNRARDISKRWVS